MTLRLPLSQCPAPERPHRARIVWCDNDAYVEFACVRVTHLSAVSRITITMFERYVYGIVKKAERDCEM
jgi:hypothetical protein